MTRIFTKLLQSMGGNTTPAAPASPNPSNYWNQAQTMPINMWVVILRIIDRSGSKRVNNAADLHYILGPGHRGLVKTLKDKGKKQGVGYHLEYISFNSTVETLHELAPIEEYPDADLPFVEPTGYTHIQDAMEFAIKRTDEIKEEFAKQGKKPAFVIILDTDGNQENENGRFDLTPAFVNKIKALNDEGHLTTIAVNMGGCNEDLLVKCAPSRTITVNNQGEVFENPHAFTLTPTENGATDELAKLMCAITVKASSSSACVNGEYLTEALFVRDENEVPAGWTGEYLQLSANVKPIYTDCAVRA